MWLVCVCVPTTPAQIFHLLRRQALGEMKRPLIVFTPKSMLRNKAAVSQPADFIEVEKFQSVIDDPNFVERGNKVIGDTDKVQTILLCSGKIYWDLAKKKEEDGRDDVAIVRLTTQDIVRHPLVAAMMPLLA